MRKTYIAALSMMAFLMGACGSDDKKSDSDRSPSVKVTIQKVETDDDNPLLTASGRIQARNSANLSTRMMGFVTRIHVKVGEEVKRGQMLITVNNSELQAKAAQVNAGIAEATAAYNNAKKDYDRFKNLFAEESASQKEMDDIAAHFEMARARLEAAKQMKNEVDAQFSYADIRSPFNGVVTNRFIEVGDMAKPGIPLLAVETPGLFEVNALIPESEISQIRSDIEVEVLVKSIDKLVKGKVTEVSTSAKNTGGQYMVKVDLGKTDAAILSGMYATVQFPIEKASTSEGRVLIPIKALVNRGQLTGIYTVSQSNTALLRWLRLGRTFGEQVEVLSGLSADESFILSSEGKLYNGARIIVQ